MRLVAGARSFERTNFPYAGTFTRLIVKANRNPDGGDRWISTLELRHPDLGTVALGAGTISYDAGLDCLLFNNSALFCGVFVPPDSNLIYEYDVITYFDPQCVPLRDFQGKSYEYQFTMRYAFAGGAGSFGDFPFKPVEFPVGVPEISISQPTLHPEIPGTPHNAFIPPDQTLVEIQALDGIQRPAGGNCGQPLADVPIKLIATVVPQTGSHLHFTNSNEPATGEFIELPFVFPPQLISDDGTMLDGVTDGFGQLLAAYEAGFYGLREQVKVQATDPNYGGTTEAVDEMSIRVPGLVPLETTSTLYSLRGGGTSACDVGHNDTSTQRRSHYVTPAMRDFIGTLAGRFYSTEGVALSLNDASLEFGGFFDDGVRNASCHVSHRQGNDIDVNVASADYAPCTGGSGLTCAATNPRYVGYTRRQVLNLIATLELQATIVNEPTIHYRVPGAVN